MDETLIEASPEAVRDGELQGLQGLHEGLTVGICTYRRASSVARILPSIFAQTRMPDQLVIVDASPDSETEEVLNAFLESNGRPFTVNYRRVSGALRGLTRQRNAILKLADRTITVFFDDDVILDKDCLATLEKVLNARSDVSGVAACNRNELSAPALRWRLLCWVRGVPDLVPGRYHRCGLAIPLSLVPTTPETVEVDRLCGNAMAWRTDLARRLGFAERFHGYAQSEDVEFSRRAARHGRLLICNRAKVDHYPDQNGRPQLTPLARMGVVNRYYVHATTLTDRTRVDVLRFIYANFCYELILGLSQIRERGFIAALQYFSGGILGALDIIRGKTGSLGVQSYLPSTSGSQTQMGTAP
jgi:GT2 family glycosyltransferase